NRRHALLAPAFQNLAQQLLVAAQAEHRTIEKIEVRAGFLDPADVLAPLEFQGDEFLDLTAVFLLAVDGVDESPKQGGVARLEQEQALFVIGRGAGAEGEDDGVAENLVPELRRGDLQVLLQILLELGDVTKLRRAPQ